MLQAIQRRTQLAMWAITHTIRISWKRQSAHRMVWIMSEAANPSRAPASWQQSLKRSKAQIAAGQSVPLLPTLDRLRASAERLEAEMGVTSDEAKPSPPR